MLHRPFCLLAASILMVSQVFAARGVCYYVVEPRSTQYDSLGIRLFIGNREPPIENVGINNHEERLFTRYFDDVGRYTQAQAHSKVDDEGEYVLTAYFDGVAVADSDVDPDGITFFHKLTCELFDTVNRAAYQWVGAIFRDVTNSCGSGLLRKRSGCQKTCVQCIEFDGPSPLSGYNLRFQNKEKESLYGFGLHSQFCYLHNSDVPNVIYVKKYFGWGFGGEIRYKTKQNTWVNVAGGGRVRMTRQC